MKTAISLPDDLFSLADDFAKQHGLSRSELYATALRTYIGAHRCDNLTERINRACEEFDTQLPAADDARRARCRGDLVGSGRRHAPRCWRAAHGAGRGEHQQCDLYLDGGAAKGVAVYAGAGEGGVGVESLVYLMKRPAFCKMPVVFFLRKRFGIEFAMYVCVYNGQVSTINKMSYRNYSAIVEYDAEDKIFVGHLLGIRDIVGFHGSSVEELENAFHDAVDHYLEICEKIGQKPQKSYSGKLTLRIPPETHFAVANAAESNQKSINQWAADLLRRAAIHEG